jgi:hypothetical protein
VSARTLQSGASRFGAVLKEEDILPVSGVWETSVCSIREKSNGFGFMIAWRCEKPLYYYTTIPPE